MSYQVLARKWRPRIFSEMIGQEHVVRALSNALDHDRLHHAYLFTGTRGVGKTTLARIFSKSLNCEQGVGSKPCGECSACREIDEGRFVDLLEVDAASRTKVDQTRELLENVPYAPVRGRYKVYLIDEVHMFSDSSFNALLKTLEEPPPHVKFLLATTDPQKVPMTVLSRCLQFNLKRLALEQIRDHLKQILEKEGIEHELPALTLLARGADGSMRDALSLMDQAIAFGGGRVIEPEVRSMLGAITQDRVHQLLHALADQDPAGMMEQVAMLAELAPDYTGVLQELLALLHRIALVQSVPEALDDSAGDLEQVRALTGKIAAEDVQLFYQIALIGQRDLPLAPDPRSGFEMVLLRMLTFRPDQGDATKGPAAAKGKTAPVAPVRKKQPPETQPSKEAKVPSSTGTLEQTGVTAARDELDLSQWHQVVASLKLGGVAKQLASNCVFHTWDGTNLELRLDPSHGNLQVGTTEQRLHKALEAMLGRSIRLLIKTEAPVQATPAQIAAKEREARRQDAAASLAEDPLVKSMEERFGAKLVPDSIRPVDD